MELLSEARTIHLASGDLFFASMDGLYLGIALRQLGRLDEATDQLALALRCARDVDARQIIASVLVARAHIALDRADDAQALALLREGLADVSVLHLAEGALMGVEGVAMLATARGDADTAVALFAAVERLRRDMDVMQYPADQARVDARLATCRRALDDDRWNDAWAMGSAHTLDAAIALAQRCIARWWLDETA